MIRFKSPLEDLLGIAPRASMRESIAGSEPVSLIALVVGNLIPVIVAIAFGWNVGEVAIFYWWENIIIGIYSALRIAFARGGGKQMSGVKWFLIPFFCAHYFFFCFIHLIFLRVLFDEEGLRGSPFSGFFSQLADLLPAAAWIGIAALLISHGISFFRNYIGRGEYKTSVAFLEMFRPYGRIVLLHICIIAGGWLMFMIGSSTPMVILLMLGKTALDVVTHSASHDFSRRLAAATAQEES